MVKTYFSAVRRAAAAALQPALAVVIGAGFCTHAYAQATSAEAASACRYTEVGTMHVSYPYPASMPAIQGEINGGTVNIGIDTGATRTMLLRAEADHQHLALMPTGRRVIGIGGVAMMYGAQVKDLSVGGTHIRHSVFPVSDLEGQTLIGMIFGTDFLFKNDVEISLSTDTIKMFHAEGCAERALAYWDADAMNVDLLNFDESGNRHAVVAVSLNAKNFRAIIDTGAGRSLVASGAAEQLGIRRDGQDARTEGRIKGFGNDTVEAWSAVFDSFAIGRESITRPRITVGSFDKMRRFGLNIDMILGRDFLKAHHVLIAASQKQFYYTYLGTDVFTTQSGALAGPAALPATTGEAPGAPATAAR